MLLRSRATEADEIGAKLWRSGVATARSHLHSTVDESSTANDSIHRGGEIDAIRTLVGVVRREIVQRPLRDISRKVRVAPPPIAERLVTHDAKVVEIATGYLVTHA